jgi:hypothetical protein
VRRFALVPLLAVALVAAGCGKSEKSKRHDAVDAYFGQLNAVRTHYAPAFAHANTALQRYAHGPVDERTLRDLRAAARTLDAAERRVRGIAAPPDALPVRRAVVHLYELEAALAHEVVNTAAFSPLAAKAIAPLKPATLEFNQHVRTDRSGSAQASALATYAAKLLLTAKRLQALAPPPVLVPWRNEQRSRLRSTAATCARLAEALRAHDAVATRALTRRLRAQLSQRLGVTTAQQAAVRAFNARLNEVVAASRAVDKQRSAVEQKLG